MYDYRLSNIINDSELRSQAFGHWNAQEIIVGVNGIFVEWIRNQIHEWSVVHCSRYYSFGLSYILRDHYKQLSQWNIILCRVLQWPIRDVSCSTNKFANSRNTGVFHDRVNATTVHVYMNLLFRCTNKRKTTLALKYKQIHPARH